MAKPDPINVEWSPFRAWARPKSRPDWHDWLFLVALALLGVFYCMRAAKLPEYQWNWGLLFDFLARKNSAGSWEWGLLAKGFFTTLKLGIWTIIFSTLVGGILGIMATRKFLPMQCACQIYVNLFRNTPPLVIIFAIYFFADNIFPIAAIEDAVRGLPAAIKSIVAAVFAAPGQMDRMIAAILALGLYQAAYVAEIVRGGLESIPQGQWDAAHALGFSSWQTVLLVIMPQAARLILPPLTGQAISSFKESALASLISVPELTFQSLEIMAVTRMTFEIWLSTAILYLAIGFGCASIGTWLEKRYSIK